MMLNSSHSPATALGFSLSPTLAHSLALARTHSAILTHVVYWAFDVCLNFATVSFLRALDDTRHCACWPAVYAWFEVGHPPFAHVLTICLFLCTTRAFYSAPSNSRPRLQTGRRESARMMKMVRFPSSCLFYSRFVTICILFFPHRFCVWTLHSLSSVHLGCSTHTHNIVLLQNNRQM